MKFPSILLILFLQIVSSCTSVNVLETEAEEGFQLSDYSSFGFYQPKDGEQSPLLPEYQEEVAILKEEIAEKLKEKGLSQSNQPDLLVNIGAVVEEKTQTRETNIMEAPRYIGQRRYSWKSEEVVANRYKLGTVTVHLVDNNENKLVWRGVAEGIIPESEKRLRKTIEKGVDELFNEIQ